MWSGGGGGGTLNATLEIALFASPFGLNSSRDGLLGQSPLHGQPGVSYFKLIQVG